MQPFHNGAFRLARETVANRYCLLLFLIPPKCFPAGKLFFFWPVKIRMHFLEPVSPEWMTTEQLKEKVFARMKEYYIQHH